MQANFVGGKTELYDTKMTMKLVCGLSYGGNLEPQYNEAP